MYEQKLMQVQNSRVVPNIGIHFYYADKKTFPQFSYFTVEHNLTLFYKEKNLILSPAQLWTLKMFKFTIDYFLLYQRDKKINLAEKGHGIIRSFT